MVEQASRGGWGAQSWPLAGEGSGGLKGAGLEGHKACSQPGPGDPLPKVPHTGAKCQCRGPWICLSCGVCPPPGVSSSGLPRDLCPAPDLFSSLRPNFFHPQLLRISIPPHLSPSPPCSHPPSHPKEPPCRPLRPPWVHPTMSGPGDRHQPGPEGPALRSPAGRGEGPAPTEKALFPGEETERQG